MSGSSEDPPVNPIVALAMRIRARRDLEGVVDAGTPRGETVDASNAAGSLEAFGTALQVGAKRLNTILGRRGVTFVRLEKPLRLRVRFRDQRISLDLDDGRQLIVVKGADLDGEYQFDTGAAAPALINLSKLSTEAGYGDALTPSSLLKAIARDVELPRPSHLDDPLQF